MKHFILCADDYGQNPAISQAIIHLVEKKRLSAVSCMTNFAHWSQHARDLVPYESKVQIGLHFNLTDGPSLSGQIQMNTLGKLLLNCYLRRVDKQAIAAELNAQIDAFVAGMGRLPDFVDGHQHVHQFPVIRDVLLAVYEKRLRGQGTYIRCVYDPKAFFRYQAPAYLKRVIIQLTGARALKRELIKRQIPHNTSFSGIYDFAEGENYALIFPQFMAEIAEGGLIMCHPGLGGEEGDSIYRARRYEYEYLLHSAPPLFFRIQAGD